MKKGISLIVLIITIIVVIILAGAVLLNLNDTNVINNANESVFKSDLQNVKAAVSLAIADAVIEAKDVTTGRETVDWSDATAIQTNVPGINSTLAGQITVEDGVITYTNADATDLKNQWAADVGGITVTTAYSAG